MTPEQALMGVNRLKASYPTMKPLDELTVSAYVEEILPLKWEDFATGAKHLVRNSKFFPSIAEILDATGEASIDRWMKGAAKRLDDERKEIMLLSKSSGKTFSERMAESRSELEALGVLPKMPTGKLVDSPERRQILMAQAEQLKGESDAEWDARKQRLMKQAKELTGPATPQPKEMQP